MRNPYNTEFSPFGGTPRFHRSPDGDPHFGPDDFGHGGRRGGGRPDRGRGFGPRGPRRAGRGDVRLAILSLLSENPSNGYGLINAITEKTGSAWRPSPGSVYPTLQQLVDEDLISAAGDSRSTEYELTEAGRAYVTENDAELTRIWASVPGHSESEMALHESVTKLKGVIHQFRLSATDEQRTAAVEKLDDARRALYLILAD